MRAMNLHRRATRISLAAIAACCALLLLLCATTLARAQVFKLPDTGQTKCYRDVDPYDEIPCAGTGQDGEYNINPMSYTDNGDGTVTDNNTGSMWQKEDGGNRHNWYVASGTYNADYNPNSESVCGSLGLAGQFDWRLPTRKELISIVDYAVPYPGPNIRPVFTNAKSSSYWSSSAYAYNPYFAWYVDFTYGHVADASKNYGWYVRCVRGGQTRGPSLINNYNGTVTDARTGLVWQRGEPGGMKLGKALTYCEELNLGGRSDWRLPNVRELESLVDDSRYNPAIDSTHFPTAKPSWYLSSTSPTDSPHQVGTWYVDFYRGYVNLDDRNYSYCVRCVRGGQSGHLGTSVFSAVSSGAFDGWVLESSETSGMGGTMNAAGSALRMGDASRDRAYRSILSFDTSGLPDNAQIVLATLRLRRQAVVGSDPFATHGPLYGDVIKGTFSGKAALQVSDFSAAATGKAALKVSGGIFGGWYATAIGLAGRAAINKTGLTQVRLRFARDDDDDGTADYLSIHSGNTLQGVRPVLEVVYWVP